MTSERFFLAMHRVWSEAQGPMQGVERWGNFDGYTQNSLQHAYSVLVVADFVLHGLQDAGVQCNGGLVRTAVQVHDLGEPGAGGDQLYEHKNVKRDAWESEVFFGLTQNLPRRMRDEWRMAFLLQFCLGEDHSSFSNEAQSIMRYLKGYHRLEARTFDLIERLDYLTSAYVGYLQGIQNEDETMIEHTVKNQVPKLDSLVISEPRFKAIWSPRLRNFFVDLVTTKAAQ